MAGLTQFVAANWLQVVDVLLVAILLYYTFKFTRGTRAAVFIYWISGLALLYFLCQYLRLITLVFIIERLLLLGPIAVVVLFTPEIRQMLALMASRMRVLERFLPQDEGATELTSLESLVESVEALAEGKIGALLVIERRDHVDSFIVPGTELQALVSVRLIESLFEPHNPLHDGALLIREDRVHSAENFLPISEANLWDQRLGTRHRAAVGLTERCDAVVIVVSEETGAVSVACHGRLARGLTPEHMQEQVQALVEPNENFSTPIPRALAI